MLRLWKFSAIALLALVTLAPAASARGAARGVVVVRPYRYRVYYGPAFYPGFYGPGWWYDPWYSPWYGPWWEPAYFPGPHTGEIKIITKSKDALIYVDGGFAGRAGKLKKFPLRAGTHTIQLRDSRGHTIYQERVHVIPGKTLKIHADYSG